MVRPGYLFMLTSLEIGTLNGRIFRKRKVKDANFLHMTLTLSEQIMWPKLRKVNWEVLELFA